MPGRIIPLVTGQFYHVYNRGINKQPIFRSIVDYQRALELIRFYQYSDLHIRYSKYQLLSNQRKQDFWQQLFNRPKLSSIICYCFMPNHFHFLLEQKMDNGISKFIGNFQNSYTLFFNKKYKCSGPLLQGQFKALRIEDEKQFLHLHRYIHLNPYSSFVIKNLSDLSNYRWSSFPEYLEKDDRIICSIEKILSYFKNKDDYKSFILNQADYQRELEVIKHLALEET